MKCKILLLVFLLYFAKAEASGSEFLNFIENKNLVEGKVIAKIILQEARKHNVDPLLLTAVINHESSFNQNAVSPVGAIGLGQIMPATANELNINPYSLAENIGGSAKYLRKMLNYNDNNVSLALASYNAGYGNVQKHGGIPPFSETQSYVKNVMNTYEQLTEVYRNKKPKNQQIQNNGVENKKIGKKNNIFFPI